MGGTRSIADKSRDSRGTKRTGTMSRKSKQEEDFENMTIDEV